MRRLLMPTLPQHGFAAAMMLGYTWALSQSSYFQTGLQFIAPALVVMIAHLVWMGFSRDLAPGFSLRLMRRAGATGAGLALLIFVGSIIAPSPAEANAGQITGTILMVVFCLAIVAIVAMFAWFILWSIVSFIKWLLGIDQQGPKSRMRLFDFGTLGVVSGLLILGSTEGVIYHLPAQQTALAQVEIQAAPERVWTAMETATSPDFPLPGLLHLFPQPIAVTTDQGTRLGADRRVIFQGREGTGMLHLQVVDRTASRVGFDVLSDTSPYADWIGYDRLTYEVAPSDTGTRLIVRLDYHRKLSPAWFFGPAMRGAAIMAMGVLARDVKARSEG